MDEADAERGTPAAMTGDSETRDVESAPVERYVHFLCFLFSLAHSLAWLGWPICIQLHLSFDWVFSPSSSLAYYIL